MSKKTPQMPIPLSLHARQRMTQRNISWSEVRQCLRQGQAMQAKAGQSRLRLGDLVVVHDGRAVITVFRRPSLRETLYTVSLRWSLAEKLAACGLCARVSKQD